MAASTEAALEAYVLALGDSDRRAVLEGLVEGSEAWFELTLLEALAAGKAGDEATRNLVERFQAKFPGPASQRLSLRRSFLAAGAAAEGSALQKQLLKDLGQNTLGLRFGHAGTSGSAGQNRKGGGKGGGKGSGTVVSQLQEGVLPGTKEVLAKLYAGDTKLTNGGLPQCCFSEVDFKSFTDDTRLMNFLRSHELPFFSENPTFLEAVAGLIARHKAKRGGADWAPKDLVDKLTLKQLEKLVQMDPDLSMDFIIIQCIISRKFWKSLDEESQNLLSWKQRRESLLEIVAFIDYCCPAGVSPPMKSNSSPGSLRVWLLYEILQLGVQLAIYDKDLLLRYMREAPASNALNPLRIPSVVPGDFTRLPLHAQPAVKVHLREFVLDAAFVEEVKQFLEKSGGMPALKELRNERCLTSGMPLGHGDIDSAWMQRLTEQSKVEILPHNAVEFPPEAEVKLFVRLKNVPRLTAHIFEISAENYYVLNQKPFTADINLEGVGASFEQEFSYSQTPILEHDEELAFPVLAGRPGLYVLDLVGSGLRSRAVIRKGTLSFTHKTSPVGHVAYVLGPDREVVQKGARLHLSGHWYESDESKGGRIIIPYGKQNEVLKVVISALGTAQFTEFARQAESYALKVSFGLLPESIIMGQKAKLLVRPRLLCCGRRCDPKLLRNAKVTVTMQTGEEGIPAVRSFSDFELGADAISVEFLVPPRLKSVEASFTADVFNYSQKRPEPVMQTRSWSVEDHSNESSNLCEFYLANSAQGYEVRILGKDGEPLQGVPCQISVQGVLGNIDLPQLASDNFGRLQLGQLPHVSCLSVTTCGMHRTWQLLPAAGQLGLSLPSQVDALENEEIRLPCPYLYISLKPHLVTLIEVCGPRNWPASLQNERLRLEPTPAGTGAAACRAAQAASTLVISGLGRGKYRLLMAGEEGEPLIAVEVHVHQGKRLGAEYMLTPTAILENREHPSVLTISDAAALSDKVTASILGSRPGTRIHIFGFNFMPSNLPRLLSELQEVNRETYTAAMFPFQMWKNLYQSDVSLGSESSYVLRRRKAESQVGNMLKKPQLCLHPRELRDTSFEREHLEAAGAMDAALESFDMAPSMAPMMQAPMMMSRSACSGGGGGGYDGGWANSAKMKKKSAKRHDDGPRILDAEICSFQNFLKSEPFVALNLKPSANGFVEVQADLSGFSSLLIIAADERSVAHRLLPLEPYTAEPPASRGLALESALDAGLACVEKRASLSLLPGEVHNLADHASAEWRAVDTVERLLAFFRAVSPELAGPLEELGFSRWNSMEKADKLELWSKNACHELHLFLRFKDLTFFTEVVLPFLNSKMERDIVDSFLLQDVPALRPMLTPACFHTLNPLEQVLTLRLLSREHPEECCQLASAMSARAQAALKSKGAAHYNALLDSVLSLEPCQPSDVDMWAVLEEDGYASSGSDRGKGKGGARGGMNMRSMRRAPQRASSDDERSLASAEEECFAAPPPPAAPMMFDQDDFAPHEVQAIMAKREPEPFQEVGTTKEFAETFYKGGSCSFSLNAFWAAAAKHACDLPKSESPLLATEFVYATSCLTEAAGALALLELPFNAAEHSLLTHEGLKATFVAQSPCIFVSKEIVGVPAPKDIAEQDLLVTVRVFKAKDSEETSQDPRAVKEFLVSVPYCLQVVVTNVSPKNFACQLLVQVPEGALPLGSASYTRAYPQQLGAFACCRVAVHFYFPAPGKFAGAPVACSVDGRVVALSGGVSYNVVQEPSHVEVRSFADVLGAGDDAVLAFLEKKDLFGKEMNFSFQALYPLLSSEAFCQKAIGILRSRGMFERTVWGYGFLHGNLQACKELLQAETDIHKRLGPFFDSPLLRVSASDADFKHLDYYPLVNKRVHHLGEEGTVRPILNRQLKATYEMFLRSLASKPGLLGPEERLRITYYLLCQDRVKEAAEQFQAAGGAVTDTDCGLKLQRDYIAAYLDLFDASGQLATARRVAKDHAECPHAAWRERFHDLARVLSEIDGPSPTSGTGHAPAVAPALDAEIRSGVLHIQAEGLDEIKVRLYKVDLEMLFSRTPFLKESAAHPEFSFVKPVFEGTIPGGAESWKVPEEHRKDDLAVEISSGVLKVFNMHFASSLRVAIAEQHGYLTATSAEGRPLPAVYVKVFARSRGKEQFFKDGYTDLRGRFDYASLSGQGTSSVDRFALLVASEDGGLVREAAPPRSR
eukprot:TRINITY_DN18983_c0_g1_i2.p1 TRINITY_DN18983_c0_g1~~TRINITY_DN18983_c0_g1_i2.p1  ORF type:complete len:2222 (-),score=469.43 TRINITY_DN18983_c0_g1_i2:81-6668(-)